MMTDVQSRPMDDLEVYVAELAPERQIYSVRVTLADGRNFIGSLNIHDLGDPPDGSASDLEAYGLDLFNRLFNDSLADAFDYAWATAGTKNRGIRLRLWLESDDVRLHNVPWELLYYDDSGGLSPPVPITTSAKVAFSRYLTSSAPRGVPIQQRPLRMLVVISAPRDLGTVWPQLAPIDKGLEQRDLRSVFNTMHTSGQLDFQFLKMATADALHAALDKDYHVLLYYGHAISHPHFGTRLVLEDETGMGQLYDGAELVRRMKHATRRPQLIVLVACNTAAHIAGQQDGYPLGSLAAQLVQRGGVPAVLAMQQLVEVALARNFTHHLSEFLLQHGIIDVAVNSARQRIAESGNTNWSTPVLYMRNRDGRLFAPNALLDYAKVLLGDARFARWQQPDFIRVEVIPVPPGQHWALLHYRPQDAPPGQDALVALQHHLQLDADSVQPNLIALIGSPYAGRTTTLRRLAADLADEAQRSGQARRTIGIYVSLARYGQSQKVRVGRQLDQLIIDTARAQVPALGDELQRLFQHTNQSDEVQRESATYIFLLDSLDAVAETQRRTASEDIVALARDMPDHRVVVSCIHYRFPVEIFADALVLLLQPLNERQVLRYLRQQAADRSSVLFRQMAESRLLDLATNPSLLAHIYARLAADQTMSLTRNQFMQDLLDKTLNDIDLIPPYTQGDVARETLMTLAWEMHWRYTDTLPLQEVFRVMADVRRNRDYSLEYLYQKFRDAHVLTDVGGDMVRFVHPIVHSYCAALALYKRHDFIERLNDICAMCGVTARLKWWEDVLYALAGLVQDTTLLRLLSDIAFTENSGPHTLLVARCLEALSTEAEQSLASRGLQELVDACAVRLRIEREPATERRAQIATALGRVNSPQAIRELRRLLIERVRQTASGPRYDHANVRIAAARALRTLVTRLQSSLDRADEPAATVVPPDAAQTGPALPFAAELVGQNSALFPLLQAWSNGAVGYGATQQEGLAILRKMLTSESSDVLERTIAAFALGDLAMGHEDARLLRDTIVAPCPTGLSAEAWDDMTWSAADALTLFDPEQVTMLLVDLFQAGPPPAHSIRQIAYVAGRVRTRDEAIIRWLIEQVLHNPDHFIKAVALRSLAWLGKGLSSFRWLHDVVQGMYAIGADGQLDALILRVVTDIAAWHHDALNQIGSFDTLACDAAPTIYLRSKALAALAWIGDQTTITALDAEVHTWPLELRETWYITANAITMRLSSLP